eukprot:scaffold16118_cov78-Skeletonema_dohrnii-CCMP3373.AAC.1
MASTVSAPSSSSPSRSRQVLQPPHAGTKKGRGTPTTQWQYHHHHHHRKRWLCQQSNLHECGKPSLPAS